MMNDIDDSVTEQACQWIVKLDAGKLSKQEEAAFKKWVAEDKSHELALRSMANMWERSSEILVTKKPITDKPRNNTFNMIAVAASILVCAISLYLLRNAPEVAPQQPQIVKENQVEKSFYEYPLSHQTRIGEHKSINLEDGTVVAMNTNSRLEIHYDGEQRAVHLIQGEAIFTVAHDPTKPFYVVTPENAVRAVGTEFSVELLDDTVEIIVTEGVVELSAISGGSTDTNIDTHLDKQLLILGRQEAGNISVLSDKIEVLEPLSEAIISEKLSWKDGILTYRNKSLEYVVNDMMRYTNSEIIIVDKSLHNIMINGRFRSGEIEGFILALQETFGVEVSKSEGRVFLSAGN